MPVPLIVICAVLLLLVCLLALRVRLILTVGERVTAELRVLLFRFRLYPQKKRRKRSAPKTSKKNSRKSADHPSPVGTLLKQMSTREKIRTVRGLLALLVRRTRKYLRLRAARIHIRVATGDAATTAIAYGAVSQSIAYLLALLDRVTRLKARPPQVAVQADFLSEHSKADIKLVFSISVYGFLVSATGILMAYQNAKQRTKKKKR